MKLLFVISTLLIIVAGDEQSDTSLVILLRKVLVICIIGCVGTLINIVYSFSRLSRPTIIRDCARVAVLMKAFESWFHSLFCCPCPHAPTSSSLNMFDSNTIDSEEHDSDEHGSDISDMDEHMSLSSLAALRSTATRPQTLVEATEYARVDVTGMPPGHICVA